jgi:hypothetical protein
MTEKRKQDAALQARLTFYLCYFAADLLDQPKFAADPFNRPDLDAITPEAFAKMSIPPGAFFKVSKAIEQVMDIFGYDTHKMH